MPTAVATRSSCTCGDTVPYKNYSEEEFRIGGGGEAGGGPGNHELGRGKAEDAGFSFAEVMGFTFSARLNFPRTFNYVSYCQRDVE
jgi:hypothetical protein